MSKVAILESKFLVPTELVPINTLNAFMATVKDRDGDDINLQFFEHNYDTGYTEFARGNFPLLRKHFSHLKIEDRRSAVKMNVDLQFTETLRPNQQIVADEVLKTNKGFGVIAAPPRFGKTVLMTYLTCKFGLKTLFLSHQADLSRQALDTFWKMTNILDLEYSANKPLIGLVENWSDLDKYEIAFMPYQKFIKGKGGEKMLEKYKNSFGCLWVDECHKSNAPRYSEVVSRFNARHRYGVSATVKIKSQMHVVSEYVLGPIIAGGKANEVPCQVRIVKTNVSIPLNADKNPMFFVQMLDYLSNHKYRNQFIRNYIAAYLDQGHYCVAVAERTKMLNDLNKQLQDAGYDSEAFHGRVAPSKSRKREEILKRARSGKTTALIANRSMVLGLDVPRLTAFFNMTPSANPPNYYQEFSRVRTPFEGKYLAYIVDFVDNHPVAYACLKNRKRVYKKHNFEVIES